MATEFTVFDVRPGAVPAERHYELDWGVDAATIQSALDDMQNMADTDGNVRLMMVVDDLNVATMDGITEKMKHMREILRLRGRYALVTDSWLMPLFYPLIRLLSPLTLRRFRRSDIVTARQWVKS